MSKAVWNERGAASVRGGSSAAANAVARRNRIFMEGSVDERGVYRERATRSGASQSTEISDAKSERGQKDRIGWRLSLRSGRPRYHDRVAQVRRRGDEQHLHDRGQ